MLKELEQVEREVSTLEQLTFGLGEPTQLLVQGPEWEQEPPWQELGPQLLAQELLGLLQVPEVQRQLELQSWEDSQAPCSAWVRF